MRNLSNFLMTLIVLAASIQVDAKTSTNDKTKPTKKTPPPYQLLRYMEDYSYLETNPSDDLFDKGKHLPLGDAWRITFGGQERVRSERKSNLGFGGANPADDGFLINRLRAHVDAQYKDSIRIFADVKSAVSSNKGGSTAGTDDRIDTQNLFLELKAYPQESDSLSLRIGRQELVFGKQRLLTNLIWANVLRTFDGLRFTYQTQQDSGDWTLSGWWARFVTVQDKHWNDSSEKLQTFGLYATNKCSKTNGYDLYAIGKTQDEQSTPKGFATDTSVALGTRWWGPLANPWFYETEWAVQPGRRGDENTFAWMASSTAGLKLRCPVVEKVSFGYDYASGDDDGTGGDTFDQYFPLGHAYFGYIDVVGRSNIHAVNTRLDFKVIPKTKVWLQLHSFWLDSVDDGLYGPGGTRIRSNTTGNGDKHVGVEVDLAAKVTIDRHSNILLGYSHLWSGDFIKNTGAGEDIDFAYAQYQFTF